MSEVGETGEGLGGGLVRRPVQVTHTHTHAHMVHPGEYAEGIPGARAEGTG